MDNDLRRQIHNNLNLKETDELLEIWRKHDLTEWTELAFDVVQDILKNRQVELPPQDESNYQYANGKISAEAVTHRPTAQLENNPKTAFQSPSPKWFIVVLTAIWPIEWIFACVLAGLVWVLVGRLLVGGKEATSYNNLVM